MHVQVRCEEMPTKLTCLTFKLKAYKKEAFLSGDPAHRTLRKSPGCVVQLLLYPGRIWYWVVLIPGGGNRHSSDSSPKRVE